MQILWDPRVSGWGWRLKEGAFLTRMVQETMVRPVRNPELPSMDRGA